MKTSRYRTIEPRIWSDAKFASLSDDGKMLWIYLLTTPYALPIPGVIVAGPAALAEGLGWPVERLRERFDELLAKRFAIRFDFDLKLVWLVNAIALQPPANPNAVIGWAKFWGEVPECGIKASIWESLDKCISDGFRRERFIELFRKPFTEPLRKPFDEPLEKPLHERLGERFGKPSALISDSESVSGISSEISEPPLTAGAARHKAWTYAREKAEETNALPGIKAIPAFTWPALVPGGGGGQSFLARFAEVVSDNRGDLEATLAVFRHVVDAVAELAIAKRDMKFFAPVWMFEVDSFDRSKSTPLGKAKPTLTATDRAAHEAQREMYYRSLPTLDGAP